MNFTKYGRTAALCGLAMTGGAYATKPWKLDLGGVMAVALCSTGHNRCSLPDRKSVV